MMQTLKNKNKGGCDVVHSPFVFCPSLKKVIKLNVY